MPLGGMSGYLETAGRQAVPSIQAGNGMLGVKGSVADNGLALSLYWPKYIRNRVALFWSAATCRRFGTFPACRFRCLRVRCGDDENKVLRTKG